MKMSYPILKFYNSLHTIYKVVEKVFYYLGNISMRHKREKTVREAANNANAHFAP